MGRYRLNRAAAGDLDRMLDYGLDNDTVEIMRILSRENPRTALSDD